MEKSFRMAVAAALCCTAAAATAQDARLVEAQTAYEEATKLKDAGKYADAIAKAERALALREGALGGTHLKVAECLNFTGDVYRLQGGYARAEPLLQRGLSIREAALGKNHPDVAASLNNLALLYGDLGLYSREESLHERALAIREAVLGKSHPDVAQSLNGLANLYMNQGLFSRAEPLHRRALAIREAALGKSHPDVAQSLYNLANLYFCQGLYNQAEPLYQRALVILEAALGKSHPDVAQLLNGLALVYAEQGLYSRAEPLYERALALQEAALGKSHPKVATSLNNLAILYSYQGLYNRAEPLYQRALVIWEAALGESHPHVAQPLYGLANLYANRGLYSRAEPLYERALSIWEAALGKMHPAVAFSINNLAGLYANRGLYSRAEPLYERALAIREAALGKTHPAVANSLIGLARLRLGQRRLAEAVLLIDRALAISEGRLRQEALDFSESRLASFIRFLWHDVESLYYLLRTYPDNTDVRRLALTSALLFKGRSVEEAADTSRTILRSMGPQDRDAFERLRELRTHLAQLSVDGPGKLSPAEYQQRLKRLADDGDVLEADLAKRCAPLRALTALPSAADILQRVTASLPRDSVLVELVAYADSPPVPKPGAPESKLPTQPRYVALMLFPGGHTSAVDLGPAGVIDKAASQLRDALALRDARFQATAQKLYRLAFKPLERVLGNTRKIFLAPDGQLALVPFAALHDGRRFLADAFDFTYLTSGRDILPSPDDIPTSTSAVILADPDYSSPPLAQAATERSGSLERFFSEEKDRFSQQPWVPLPGSRQEAEAIQRLLPQAQVFLGAEASKERLLHLAAPGILHIATHGFFLADAATAPGGRALGAQDLSGGGAVPRLPDPLLRSGLVLAGASSPADLGNSLVTALELAGLDLWGTQLVVLSSCDTGRGDVKRGQGVYGLRRALVVAGAETLVVSLWKVDDETTRTLMERYYRNLLDGHGRAAALREAMLSLRATHPHPHFWAPFIVLGRDSPLRGFGSSTGPHE